jgi:hypothetical protein
MLSRLRLALTRLRPRVIVIKLITETVNPREAFAKLRTDNAEVVSGCDDYVFTGMP